MKALADALGTLAARSGAMLETALRERFRSIAIRAGVLLVAILLAIVCLSMSALAAFLLLSEYFLPASAAAVTALIFLVLAIVALAIGVKASFRRSVTPGDRERVSKADARLNDIEHVVNDLAQMSRELNALTGRGNHTVILAALAAGVTVALVSNRK